MKDTVYVINDPFDKGKRSPRGQGRGSRANQTGRSGGTGAPQAKEPNPAAAFSLSLAMWGGGQLYAGTGNLGILLMLLMLIHGVILGMSAVFWGPVGRYAASYAGLTRAETLLALCALYWNGLVFWLGGAALSYRRAARQRSRKFTGVKRSVVPLLASLAVPGWGQYLNGQPKKGLFYLLFCLLGLAAVPYLVALVLAWRTLEPGAVRDALEWLFAGAVAAVPAVLVGWMASCLDAFKVCRHDVKKEPLRKRLEYGWNRVRLQGLVRGLIPQVRLTLITSVVLAFVVAAALHLMPFGYYGELLEGMGHQLSAQGMHVVPGLIEQALRSLPGVLA